MATTTLGADAVILLDGDDISDFIDVATVTDSADDLDVTTYGNNGHRHRGGLKAATVTLGGVYDTTASGPHDTIPPLLGTVVSVEWRPEGTGSTLPKTTGSVLVQQYVESPPVADIIRWTANLVVDGVLTYANQS